MTAVSKKYRAPALNLMLIQFERSINETHRTCLRSRHLKVLGVRCEAFIRVMLLPPTPGQSFAFPLPDRTCPILHKIWLEKVHT